MKRIVKHTIDEILKIRSLAEGSKFGRFRYHPLRYTFAISYRHLVYPYSKKGMLQKANLFFRNSMYVLLPAGMDLYLLGAKTHDSELRLALYMLKNLSKGSTVFDIGAHFGYYSLLCSHLIGASGRVVAIEASARVFQILKRNTLNNKNINTLNLGCSDQNGEIPFFDFPIQHSEFNTSIPNLYHGTDWVRNNPPVETKIEVKTLDSIVNELGFIPDFIKIDVEGAELEVIRGMNQVLSTTKNLVIAMEFPCRKDKHANHLKAANKLAEKGYLPHLIGRDGSLSEIDDLKSLDAIPLESENILFKRK